MKYANQMLTIKINSIQPQYHIDHKNNITVPNFLVNFEARKKLANGDTIRLAGEMCSELSLDISAIKGKIMYHLKDLIS